MSGPSVKVETIVTVQGRDAQGQGFSLAPGVHSLARELAEDLIARGHAVAVGGKVEQVAAPAQTNGDGSGEQDPAVGDGKGEGAIDGWADKVLAGSIPEVVAALKGLDADALQLLADVEEAGKGRKGVMEAIDEAFDNLGE